MIRIENADMREYTSFKAGGKADLLLIPDTAEELSEALKEAKDIREKTDGKSGIPGSIGGAVFMNAGAYGGEIKDVIKSVTAVSRETGEIKEMTKDELGLSYRHSVFTETGDIITEAVFELEPADREAIEEKMKDLAEKRNSKQPLQYPSAGSFFKRPEGFFAGKLIQDAGLKGLSVGGAQVSEKHSGFIINTGNATATDIISLMHLVQNTVYDKFGVMLEPEVRIVGEDAAE